MTSTIAPDLYAQVRLYGGRVISGHIVAVASDVETGARQYAMELTADLRHGVGDGYETWDYSDLQVMWVDASALVTMPVAVAA